MAFNFTALLGGMASGLSEQIEKEEFRMEKAADRAYTRSEQERLARRSKREKEQLIAKETMGMLTSLGYSEDVAAEILKKGNTASQWWITQGTEALKKGMDPNTLVNFPGMSGTFDESDKNVVSETVGSVAAPAQATTPEGLGEITEAAETGKPAKDDVLSREFGINVDVWKNLYAEPDKIETSYSGRLAVISQKLARPTKDTNVDALKSEQQQLLADLATMKEAERAKEGTTTPSFTLGTISANVSEIRRGALTKFGFKIGLNDELTNLNDGNQHLADVASMEISYQLNQRNQGISDPNMANTADAIRTTALSGLRSYGNDIISDETKSAKITVVPQAADFAAATEQGQYSPGQVVQTTNPNTNEAMYVVYTGVPDYKTGMPFIVLSGG
jgi:hypothetical protein